MRRGSLFVAAQSVLFVLIAVAPRMRRSDWPLDVRVPGIVLVAAGLLVCVWAVRTLGPAMTAMPEPRADAPSRPAGRIASSGTRSTPACWGSPSASRSRAETAAGSSYRHPRLLFDVKARYEERLLGRDPAYAAYRGTTRRRFLPGLY